MKNLLIAGAIIAWGMVGCGGGTTPSAQTSETQAPAANATGSSGNAASSAVAAIQPQTPVVLPVDASSSPQDVVLAFLNAMRDGNGGITAALLTNTAQQETIKHNW